MSLLEVIIISLALALDAFGVAISLGLDRRINKRRAFLFTLSFGFFQFLFAFIGGYSGNLFNRYIFTLPSVVGGTIILFVGILMLKDGYSNKQGIINFHWCLSIVLGICVSIDALVIGFSSFNGFKTIYSLFINSAIVGSITSFLTGISFIISKHVRNIKFISYYADFIGGIILILFGIKMILF
ncbi:manganese efflux pump MntP family protein [Thermohalobacter berrensis]|uniref:Manganese efflux pump MntP n=1 Tax=Thermohalobacter berrensis TaxID=99594 RepID=A0A419T9P4_9FIRM|nr:manganese efflux pump [Thermohalobacter berrensis]RKD34185.1 hypothetical protein BET03_07805 [Thermohalobacter berrensis]